MSEIQTNNNERADIECHSEKRKEIGPDGVPYYIYTHPMKALAKLDGPVYKLRYMAVKALLDQFTVTHNVKSVVEYGCADLKFIDFITRSNAIQLEKITVIDINRNKLLECKKKAEPKLIHHFHKSQTPFSVEICVGSIGRPYEKVKNVDAVVAIEVIEHLFPNTYATMEHNIFAYIQPKIVILTTPNADFNVLFENFNRMRDADHKFEWTREEYKDWALNITKRYPNYDVMFEGIGRGNENVERYGHVTQMAVFERKRDRIVYNEDEAYGVCNTWAPFPDDKPFETIDVITFPFVKREDFIIEKLGSFIHSSLNEECEYYDVIYDILRLPLDVIVSNFNSYKFEYRGMALLTSKNEAKAILQNAKYDFKEKNGELFLVLKNCADTDTENEMEAEDIH